MMNELKDVITVNKVDRFVKDGHTIIIVQDAGSYMSNANMCQSAFDPTVDADQSIYNPLYNHGMNSPITPIQHPHMPAPTMPPSAIKRKKLEEEMDTRAILVYKGTIQTSAIIVHKEILSVIKDDIVLLHYKPYHLMRNKNSKYSSMTVYIENHTSLEFNNVVTYEAKTTEDSFIYSIVDDKGIAITLKIEKGVFTISSDNDDAVLFGGSLYINGNFGKPTRGKKK